MKKNYFYLLASVCLLFSKGLAQAPVINPISGPSNVCFDPNASAVFSVSASNSPAAYFWSVSPFTNVQIQNTYGNTVAISFGNMNGTYTIYCFATNASGSSAIDSFVVNVFEKPNVTFSGNFNFCQGSSTNLSASPTIIPASSTLNSGSSTLFYSWSPPNGLNTTFGPNVIANPNVSTTYTVSVLNGVCTSTTALTLFVSAPPSITVNNGTICSGDSFVLQAGGASSYTYSSGSNTVSPTTSTSYTVVGTDINGCTSASVTTFVNVDPLPVINVVSNKNPICKGESNLLKASGAIIFSWTNGANGDTNFVSPISTTVYTVTGKDANNCSASAVITQSVSLCTSINEQQLNGLEQATIYPNPSGGKLSIDLGVTSGEEVHIQIMNVTGQSVFDEKTTALLSIYDISWLKSGVYFIVLKQAQNVKSLKLIRE